MTGIELLALLPLLVNTVQSTVSLIERLKPQIKALFEKGEISAEQQAQLNGMVDAILEQHKTGNLPPHWKPGQ